MIRIPAFIDLHVHFREPGFTEKEDIKSGALAAAAGGYMAVCMMPNTKPAIDNADILRKVDKRARTCGPLVFAASAMTLGQKGSELVNFDAMNNADTLCGEKTGHGVCGLSEDGKTLDSGKLMERVCEAAARIGLPVMDHAEPEVEIIKRDIELARRTGAHVHIQHISLKESVGLIRAAKSQGISITCETAPHYFVLTDTDTDQSKAGTNAKMNPPLAKQEDRMAIIGGIIDGTIDCIATDHAPHETSAKNRPFADAANGIIGLETAFPVAYTALVRSGQIGLDDLVRLMSTRPADIIGLHVTEDDYVLVDIDTKWKIDADRFCSKGRNTPFGGMEVYGRVIRTVVRGKTIYNYGEVCSDD